MPTPKHTADPGALIQELDNAIGHCRDAEDDSAAVAVQKAIKIARLQPELVEALQRIVSTNGAEAKALHCGCRMIARAALAKAGA